MIVRKREASLSEMGCMRRKGVVEIENKVRFGFDGKVRGENIDGW